MRADIPVTRDQFFAAAEARGLHIISNVSAQGLKVVSLEKCGSVLRIFAPDLRELSEGTEINGSLGIALKGLNGDYEVLFHHILNLSTLRQLNRFIRQESDWAAFFPVLVSNLNALPSNPNAVISALQDETSWLGRQFKWGRSSAVAFERSARELAAR